MQARGTYGGDKLRQLTVRPSPANSLGYRESEFDLLRTATSAIWGLDDRELYRFMLYLNLKKRGGSSVIDRHGALIPQRFLARLISHVSHDQKLGNYRKAREWLNARRHHPETPEEAREADLECIRLEALRQRHT